MDYRTRRKKLRSSIKEGTILLFSGCEICLSEDESYPFEVNRNFFYMTGIDQPDVYFVSKEKEEYLILKKNDDQMARWVGFSLFPDEAKKISDVDKTFYLEELEHKLLEIARENQPVYLDLQEIGFPGGIHQGRRIRDLLLKRNPDLEIRNIYPDILSLRAIKDKEEIAALKHSIHITRMALDEVMKTMTKLRSEKACQALFEERIATLGLAKPSFPTISAGGKNAAILHYSSNDRPLEKEDMILMDLGASVGHYNADITRTFPHSGVFSPFQRKIYELVLQCNREIIRLVRPGVTLRELQSETCDILARGLIRLGVIKNSSELNEYYFHGVSHHLGLDTHDPMPRDLPLVPGNVITVEPGLYLREYGIGVRIEDDILVTENGAENLSEEIIKEPDEIQNLISGEKQ